MIEFISSPSDIFFWIYFLYFVLLTGFIFTIPGFVVIGKHAGYVVSTVLGMVMWGLAGWMFGYLGMRWMIYPYIIIFLLLFLLNKPVFCKPKIDKTFLLSVLIIVFGVYIQMLMVWHNGFLEKEGLSFCCVQPMDALWHTSVTYEAMRNIPPFNPGMTGRMYYNYHYLMNIIVGEMVRVFRLPLVHTQLTYYPIFISVFVGLSAWVFANMYKKIQYFAPLLLFWIYFGSDIGVFVKSISGVEGIINPVLTDGMHLLDNFPRATSLAVLFAAISVYVLWLKEKSHRLLIIASILFGSLIEIKVYMGLFALLGLVFVAVYMITKRNFHGLILFFLTLIISLIVYLPGNKGLEEFIGVDSGGWKHS